MCKNLKSRNSLNAIYFIKLPPFRTNLEGIFFLDFIMSTKTDTRLSVVTSFLFIKIKYL